MAFGLKELEEIRGSNPAPAVCDCTPPAPRYETTRDGEKAMASLSRSDIEAITKAVLAQLGH